MNWKMRTVNLPPLKNEWKNEWKMEQYIFLHPGSLELHISWQAPLYLIISAMPSVSLKSSLSLYWLVFSPLKVFYLNFLLVLSCGWWTEWDDCHMGQQQKEQCQNALEKLKTKNEWKMETHQKQTHCPFLKNGCFSVIFHLIFLKNDIKNEIKNGSKMRTVNTPNVTLQRASSTDYSTQHPWYDFHHKVSHDCL